MNHFMLPLLASLLVASCAPKGPPPVYHITDTVPAGSRIEYYAQLPDDTWKPTMTQNIVPRPMPIKEVEKWALSAAEQRLGRKWKDYSIRVIPPTGEPIVVWHRKPVHQF